MKPEIEKPSNIVSDKINFRLTSKSPFYMERLSVASPESMRYYHYHDNYELYYLTSGERYYFIQDKTYHVTQGSLVLINPYEIHCTINSAKHGYDRILLNFKKEFLDGLLGFVQDIDLLECFRKEIHIIKLNPQEQHYIEGLLQTMLREYAAEDMGYDTYLKTALIQLLLFTNRHNDRLEDKNIAYLNSTHKTISEITGYINNNYNLDITLESISKQFFISPCYFSRTFKKNTGFTFIEYLNSVRIKEAQKLLRKTDFTIAEIAEAVGFKNNTHFGRVFKSITGMAPVEYRKYHSSG